VTAGPTPVPFHAGLARCALAVLLVTLSLHPLIRGVGHIANAVIFAEVPTSLGAGGYADYGTVAAHSMTLSDAVGWALAYLPSLIGMGAATLLLAGNTPPWLSRASRSYR
jgi:hypothetical protein